MTTRRSPAYPSPSRELSLLDLPPDVLTHLLTHLPRRDHLPLLSVLPSLRSALLHPSHSLALTELDLFPTASLDDCPPAVPPSLPLFLQRALHLVGPSLHVLRLHAAVPAATTSKLLGAVATGSCPHLRRVAFRDAASLDVALSTSLLAALHSLQAIEISTPGPWLLCALSALPPTCTVLTLVDVVGISIPTLLLTLRALSKARVRDLELNLQFTHYAFTVPHALFAALRETGSDGLSALRKLSVFCRARKQGPPLLSSPFVAKLRDEQDALAPYLPPLAESVVGIPDVFERTIFPSTGLPRVTREKWRTIRVLELLRLPQGMFPAWMPDVRVLYVDAVMRKLAGGEVENLLRSCGSGVMSVVVEDGVQCTRRRGMSRGPRPVLENVRCVLTALPPVMKLSLPRRFVQLGASKGIVQMLELCGEIRVLQLYENPMMDWHGNQLHAETTRIEVEELPAFLEAVGTYCKRLTCVLVQDVEKVTGNMGMGKNMVPVLNKQALEKASLAVDRLERCIAGLNVTTLRALIGSWCVEGENVDKQSMAFL